MDPPAVREVRHHAPERHPGLKSCCGGPLRPQLSAGAVIGVEESDRWTLGAAIDEPAAAPADVLVEVLVASLSEAVVLRWRVGAADLAITGARAKV